MSVKAKCKICNKEAPADSFKLHFKYRQMVCPNCFNRDPTQEKIVEKKKIPPKPPGWDIEDEYLEKMARMKEKERKAQFTKIPGTDYVKCKCMGCNYEFKYDPFRKRPRVCPFCSNQIPKLNTFSML